MFGRKRKSVAVALPPAHELIAVERLAVDLAAEAGKFALEKFPQTQDVEYKGKGRDNPVTELDRASEDLIRAGIARTFPGHCVVGEERQDTYNPDTEYIWVIDPIDGTTNFVNGLPIFAVSIGVLHHFRPVVGAIFVPNGPTAGPGIYHARSGGGAWFGDRPVRVAAEEGLIAGRTVARPGGFPGFFEVKGKIRRKLGEPRVLGSIAYEFCAVASGSLGYALFGAPRLWDVAAGVTIVREAGGLNLTYRRKGGWQELTEFAPPRRRRKSKEPLAHFHRPLAPLICGTPGAARELAAGLAVRSPGLWRRLLPFRRRH